MIRHRVSRAMEALALGAALTHCSTTSSLPSVDAASPDVGEADAVASDLDAGWEGGADAQPFTAPIPDCPRPGVRCPPSLPASGAACDSSVFSMICMYPGVGACPTTVSCQGNVWVASPSSPSCAWSIVTGGQCPPTAKLAEGRVCFPDSVLCGYPDRLCGCEGNAVDGYRFRCRTFDDPCGVVRRRGGCSCDSTNPPSCLAGGAGCPAFACVEGEVKAYCLAD